MPRLSVGAFIGYLCLISTAVLADADPVQLDDATFAIINGETISAASYNATLNNGMRQRFYHGNIPASELAAFRLEMADKIIDSILLLQEAKRRKIAPDHAAVSRELDGYERRYADSAHWQARREQLLPGLRAQLESRDILERMYRELRNVPRPDAAAVRDYYGKNPDKFTTPQKRKVSLILLKVDPSSNRDVWEAARTEAGELIERINKGESFAELARLHSGDSASAPNGGDMGYLHQGMLAEEAEAVLDKLAVGGLSAPVRTLEGIVILRLDAVNAPSLNPLESVRERATDLLYRELSAQNVERTIAQLRSSANLRINRRLIEQDNASVQ